MEVCCSYVVPLGLALNRPSFCSRRYFSRAFAQPEPAKVAWGDDTPADPSAGSGSGRPGSLARTFLGSV